MGEGQSDVGEVGGGSMSAGTDDTEELHTTHGASEVKPAQGIHGRKRHRHWQGSSLSVDGVHLSNNHAKARGISGSFSAASEGEPRSSCVLRLLHSSLFVSALPLRIHADKQLHATLPEQHHVGGLEREASELSI